MQQGGGAEINFSSNNAIRYVLLMFISQCSGDSSEIDWGTERFHDKGNVSIAKFRF